MLGYTGILIFNNIRYLASASIKYFEKTGVGKTTIDDSLLPG